MNKLKEGQVFKHVQDKKQTTFYQIVKVNKDGSAIVRTHWDKFNEDKNKTEMSVSKEFLSLLLNQTELQQLKF